MFLLLFLLKTRDIRMSASVVKVAKQEPTRLSLSGGANMYEAVHLFIRLYFFFDE